MCSSPHYAASYQNDDLRGLPLLCTDTHTHTHTHTHTFSLSHCCLLKPDMRSFLKFISKPPSLSLSLHRRSAVKLIKINDSLAAREKQGGGEGGEGGMVPALCMLWKYF